MSLPFLSDKILMPKEIIAQAIREVDSTLAPSGGNSFQQLADLIRQISTGKKWATGTFRGNGQKFTISGLDFPPKLVIFSGRWVSYSSDTRTTRIIIASLYTDLFTVFRGSSDSYRILDLYGSGTGAQYFSYDGSPSFLANGFDYTSSYASSGVNYDIRWYAFE